MADNINLARAVLQQAADPQANVLREFGYPDGFVQLLPRLHKDTSASFLVNGELSQRFPIVTGIRQGCPLAPLLFLIAAEALKHAIDQDPRISGIELHGRYATHRHVFSAFVDDSLVYLQNRNMPNKSHAIVLDPVFTANRLGAFPVVPHGHTVTYLGVEIGIAPLVEANWTKRIDAVTTRLGILSRYTTGVMDRVQIINIGCVPSLMFTAQFFTPSPRDQARIDELWRQFIWNGTVSTDPQRAHKIARPIVELPKKLGGLGLHDYRGATLTQAAAAVLRWNSRQHDKYWEAFAALLPPSAFRDRVASQVTYPSASAELPRVRLTTTERTMQLAIQTINHATTARHPHPDHPIAAKTALSAKWTEPWRGLQWQSSTTGSLRVPPALVEQLRQVRTATYANLPPELRSYWHTFPWTDNAWVTGVTGTAMTRREFPMIRVATIGDLELQQIEPGLFQFRNPVASPFELRPSSLRRLAEWVRCMIINTALLPDDPTDPTTRVYSYGSHPSFDQYEWTLRSSGGLQGTLISDKWTQTEGATRRCPTLAAPAMQWIDPAAVHQITDDPTAEAAIESLRLQPLIPMPPVPVARKITEPILKTNAVALRALHHRLESRLAKEPELSTALQHCSLANLHDQAWGLSSQQAFFWYRLTIGGLNLRDQTGQPLSCPHDSCRGSAKLTYTHMLWECPAARLFWTEVFWCWAGTRLDDADDRRQALEAVFTRNPPTLRADLQQRLQCRPK